MSEEELEYPDWDELEAKGQLMKTKILSSVNHVKVYPPPDREGQRCSIYGHISVNDDPANTPVTLFSREKDNPQTLILGHDDFSFLTLSHHDSDRALNGFFHPLLVNMELYEIEDESSSRKRKREKGKEEVLIAEIEGYRIQEDLLDRSCVFLMEGNSGFEMEVSCAVIHGARVEVGVKFNKPFDGPNSNSIFGHIGAFQGLGATRSSSRISLYDGPVVFGAPIPLTRRVVVAPVECPRYLCIYFRLSSTLSGPCFANEVIPFPIKMASQPPFLFITTKDRTHVKHVLGDLVTVSIKFIDDKEVTGLGGQ